MLVPHDSLMSIYRGIYRGFRSAEFTWDTLHVSALARDAGVLSGAGHVAVTDTTGRTVRQAVAVTYVFVRRDAGWQLLHGHASHRVLQ
ncbi:MAG TPA: nuclear transport factor 2 family protein [Gemmatimonadales bacterium]|nr:nuclear transport factor 2 family protein [Gemmatimonadales bacterium]